MDCPNCGFYVPDNANFCQNCGYRFDSVPQIEPIRVVISQPQENQSSLLSSSQLPAQTIILEQPAKSASSGVVIALTVLVTLLFIGAVTVFGFIFFATRQNEEAVAANTNATAMAANNNTIAKPAPTTYEDLKNKIAPPDKSLQLVDEEFEVAADSHRAVLFSVNNPNGAKLAGGFRVTKGKLLNLYVYPADAYAQYPTNGLKPIQLEQTRNKIINKPLQPGDYYLVFENSDEQPLTVAVELLLVSK